MTPRQPSPAMSEVETQTLFRSRARMICPAVLLIAIPNAGKRTRWAAGQARREGMTAGAPDLIALWPNGGVAFIEMKSAKGRLQPNQVEMLERLDGYGHSAFVARTADEALEFLRACGAPFIGRVMA